MERRPTRVRTTLALAALTLTLIAPGALGQDPDRIAEIRSRAEQGDVDAQFTLGNIYSISQIMSANGMRVGPEIDAAEAATWYRRAARQGHATAQNNLGGMYADGRGVAQDDAEAVRWYRQAAEQREAEAQYNLGLMYDNGRGVPENDAEAVKWYRLSARQGFAEAQSNLGFMYDNGTGVPEDDTEAVKWFRFAADQGLDRAQHNLGLMYANGKGVPQDDVLAYAWWNLATAQGNELASEYKDQLRTRMTANQIARARELSATLFDRIN